MAEEAKQPGKVATPAPVADADEDEHYEEVSEYRIGEGAPPIFLIVCFIFVVCWAMFSWVPFSDTN